jgi:hypothetical protein
LLSRRSLMNSLIAGPMALCVLILFVAGLFVTTFRHLENRSPGFSDQHVVAMEVGTGDRKQSPETWVQAAGRLRQVADVDDVAVLGLGAVDL